MNLKKEADYLEEYDVSSNPKEKRLIYHGPVFLFRGSEKAFRRYRRNSFAVDLMQLLLLILISLLDPYALRGQGIPPFMWFYMFSVFSTAYVLYTSICFLFSPREMNRKTYDRCVVNRNLAGIVDFVCVAASTGIQAWCIVIHGWYLLNELGVFMLLVLGLLLCGLNLYQQKRHGFDRQGNTDIQE